jgi:hypothetical protein
MKIAIIGSRSFPDEEMVRSFVKSLPNRFEVVSGGARGVDSWALDEAKKLGLKWYEFEPKDESSTALLARNSEIAFDCDVMVAFSNYNSRGTQDAIKKASVLYKPVFLVCEPYFDVPSVERILRVVAMNHSQFEKDDSPVPQDT